MDRNDLPAAGKPMPRPTALTRPFWEGCREGELRLQCCEGCGDYRFFPAEGCPGCGSPAHRWQTVSPVGRIYTWLIVHRQIDAAWDEDLPYAIVVVELEVPGRPLLTGTLKDCHLDAIEGGMRVRASFDAVTDEISLLRWHPEASEPLES